MPAKGDSVGAEELHLSASISEMEIISHEDSIFVFNGLPARQYEIHAIVGEIPFTLTMIVVEEVNTHPYIEKMEVSFSSAWKWELEPLKRLVETNREPTMLLIGLRSYCNEMQYRRCVWKWMKQKWDRNVVLQYGEYSNAVFVCTDGLLTPSEKPKFLLSWSISFSPEGVAAPSIYPHFSMECSDEDAKEEYDELHSEMIKSFTSLLEVRGVESAISFLMSCIL
ncbi:hypothetical protein WA556_003968 [Blastocystis sp. ATCC 50177/Nand II]